MTAADLVHELRGRGVELRADGGRILFRPAGRVSKEIRAELRRRKTEVLAALRHDPTPTDHQALARSPLVARVQRAWPWLAEHRPDLYQAVRDADFADDVTALHAGMVEASKAYEERQRGELARIYSKVLGAELWIAPDEEAAEQLRRDGETLPVLLPAEAMILGKMAQADAREIFTKLALVQHIMPGSRLRSVTPHEGGALDA